MEASAKQFVSDVLYTSESRDGGENHLPSWNVDDNMLTQGKNVKVFLKQISIPHAVPAVNSNFNKIYISEDGGGTLTATLTVNNYNGSQFATEIQTQLNAAGALTYTVTYNSQTFKLSFTVVGGDVKFVTGANTLYFMMGFLESGTGFSDFDSLTSPHVIDIAGTRTIRIASNLKTLNVLHGREINLLATIPSLGSFGSIINYEPEHATPVDISRIGGHYVFEVLLFDDRHNLYVVPPNLNWSITLEYVYNL